MAKIPLSSIRAQFPMYGDLSDDDLLIGIRRKFYADIPMAKFSAMIDRDTERQRLQGEVTDGMSGGAKFAAGVGKAGVDVARGLGQMVGAVSRDDVAESRKLDAGLMKTGAGVAGNITGNVAMLAPAALIPGVNTIAGGAAVGAAMGLAQPSESTSETMLNMALGGGAGSVVPAAARTWQAGRAMVEPFSDKGRQMIVGRALNAAAGRDAPAVRQRLAAAAAPFVGPSQGVQRTMMGEFVPGSVPTVGQASGNAGVASLERAATATNPEVTNAVSDIMRAQNTARVGVLDDLSGSGGAREFFAADRDTVAQQLYESARRAGVPANRLTPEVLQNIANVSQRVPEGILAKARELAKINGTPMDDTTSVQGLHWVKMAIDDAISGAKASGNGTLARAYTGLQKDLLKGLDAMSPQYAQARQTYASMSRPINQMDVAGAIRDKSVNKLTGNLQPNAYANALTDTTAARTLGMPGATLGGTMEPAQMNALQSILLDVQRANFAQNAGRGVGSDTVQKLAYTNMLDQAGVPSFIRDLQPAQVVGGIVGRAGDAAYGRANRELSQMLAEIMLDPGRAAAVMAKATPQQRSAIRQALGRSASGLALAAPAAANAQQ